MICNVDVKSLEWVSYLFLSQDTTGIEEWNNVVADPTKYDIHRANQEVFKLPSRLISKVFLFRAIYLGPAFAYAHDPDFQHVSKSVEFWQTVIDNFYKKYNGLYKTHHQYIREVNATGRLTSPFGREYEFKRYRKKDYFEYSNYEIANWINQGVGSDIVAVARVSAAARFRRYNLKSVLISTIHDSLTADCPEAEVQAVSEIFLDVFKDLPQNITKCLGVKWDLPMLGEVSIGPNMCDLAEITV
jgi:DNA polymerase I-like protein with 3'-5' exonuclease and polymerase domains